MRALIIEDEALIAFLVEDALMSLGFDEVVLASTEKDAIFAARKTNPDLISADVRLAVGCGISASLAISAERPVPVMFMTASPSEVLERVEQAVIIEKPFTFEQIQLGVRTCQPIRPRKF